MANENFKNILIAALGTTPQIITESLYYLMVQRQTLIHEIHMITTSDGKAKAEDLLFKDGRGAFYDFCRDFGFSSTEIAIKYHVIKGEEGKELPDIRTPQDNTAAANFFLHVVRSLTQGQDTRIFATIAGGRKTMSAYLYLTMQLLGRPQDTLYHVLVQPESIESNPAFFFPKPNQPVMEFEDYNGNKSQVKVSDIRIDMAEIPFVRLSRVFKEGVAQQVEKFADLVALTQEEIDQARFEPQVIVHLPEKTITVENSRGRFSIRLRPQQMALYAYLCRFQKLHNTKKGVEEANRYLTKIYQDEYAILGAGRFEKDDIRQLRSRINRAIRSNLQDNWLIDSVMIHSDQSRQGPTYTLRLSSKKIKIISTDSPESS